MIENDELRDLRERAYGRNADLHVDPKVLLRLHELERQAVGDEATVSATDSRQPVSGLEASPDELPPHVDSTVREAAELEAVESVEHRRRPSLKIRRSTVLIVMGLAVFATIVASTLTLVQRVQTDPLQAGARQVARLAIDPGYQIPDIVSTAATELGGRVQAFSEFHGLRPIVAPSIAVTGVTSDEKCLSIYRASDLSNARTDQISGTWFIGCAAGTFPAAAQFSLRANRTELPVELREEFAAETALQFVYDQADGEVVVFASR